MGAAAERDGSCHRCGGDGHASGSRPLHRPYAGPGVRVVGTIAVGTSHAGVIVAVPGSDTPLHANAFRLWENGRPKAIRVDPLPASALRIGVVVDAPPGDQLQGAQNAVADLMIGLPAGAEAAVVGTRPARVVQPLTGDTGSVVRALAGATFSGPRDDASALSLAVREVAKAPGRRAVVLITTDPVPASLASAVSGAASCRRCQPVRRGRAGTRAVVRPARQHQRRLGGHRVIRPLALASRRRDRRRSCPPVPARVRQLLSGADHDPSPGGRGRSGDDSDHRSDRASADRRRGRQRSWWRVCGLADRRGAAAWPDRRGHPRYAAATAPARPLGSYLRSPANCLPVRRPASRRPRCCRDSGRWHSRTYPHT